MIFLYVHYFVTANQEEWDLLVYQVFRSRILLIQGTYSYRNYTELRKILYRIRKTRNKSKKHTIIIFYVILFINSVIKILCDLVTHTTKCTILIIIIRWNETVLISVLLHPNSRFHLTESYRRCVRLYSE